MGEAYLRRYGILVTGECPKGGEHDWKETGEAGTCQTPSKSWKYCTKCFAETDKVTGDYGDHSWVETGRTTTAEPTCTEDGTVRVSYTCGCDECEATTTKTESIECLGHDWDWDSGAVHPPCKRCDQKLGIEG